MKNIIVTLLSFFCLGSLSAQTFFEPKAIPSPNAASLSVYGEVPVGYYTGVPDINIPLYELELDGMKFPLSLNYHASGVRVAQDAGWVGMGWSLNAGGCITCSVRGWADYGPGIGKYDPPKYNDLDKIGASGDMLDYEKFKLIIENKVDSEPDIFYFNFGRYSGKFFVQKDYESEDGTSKTVVQSPNSFLDIQYDGSNWIVTDGNGFIYHFGMHELTRSRAISYKNSPNLYSATSKNKVLSVPLREVQPELTTAWYLDSIVSPNGRRLTFTYTTEEIYTPLSMQETIYEPLTGFDIGRASYTNYSFSENKVAVLTKISGTNLDIDFVGEVRHDIEPHRGYQKPTRLAEISIKNNQSLIKKYRLDYFYTGTLDDYDNCRLFLNGVQEYGADRRTGGRHSLGYYEGALPSKISTEVDYWGYYNRVSTFMASHCWGKTVEKDSKYSTLIPPYKSGNLSFYGQNRSSDSERMRYGALKWIKYPTGGQTVFEFEPHQIVAGLYDDIPSPSEEITKTVDFYDVFNGYSTEWNEDSFSGGNKEGESFEILSATPASLQLNIEYLPDDPLVLEDLNLTQKYTAFLKKYNETTGKYETVSQVVFPKVDGYDSNHEEFQLELQKGRYRMDISRSYKFSELEGRLVSFDMIGGVSCVYSSVTEADPIGGGLCVKVIESTDLNGNKNRKTYDYYEGTLMSPIISHTLATQETAMGSGCTNSYGTYLCGLSDSYVPLSSSAAGNSVGYNSVRETLYEGDRKKGYTMYEFYNDRDELTDTKFFVPGFPVTMHLSNGLVKKKSCYNEGDKLVYQEKYEYDFADGSSARGLRAYKPQWECTSIYFKFYDIYSSWSKLKSKAISEYDLNGKLIWNTLEQYTYEPSNYKVKEVKTEDSRNGITRRKVLEYPVHLKSSVSCYQRMVDNKVVNPVVEERDYILRGANSALLDTKRIIYDTFGSKILPASLRQNKDKGSSTLEERLRIGHYDKNGQANEYIKGDSEKTVYLWGYGSMYPVAKIEGAYYQQVQTWLGATFIDSLADNGATVEAALKTLRSILSGKNVLVTTYTYKPLIGMLTTTAPNGEVTTYEYDSLGRLSKVKDHNNKVTEQYDYNYKP